MDGFDAKLVRMKVAESVALRLTRLCSGRWPYLS